MMKTDDELEAHLSRIAQDWVGTVLILGAFLFPLLSLMDFLVTPANFMTFLIYRFMISFLLMALYFLNKMKTSKNFQYLIIIIATSLSALTIELMVLRYGGHASTYYAGMNLVAICSLGFVPINLFLSSVILLIIYGIYFIPIATAGSITDPVFISNNAFMIATFVIALAWRHQNQKLIINEFALREELDRKKRRIEEHSVHLEDLVVERTKELSLSEQRHRALFDNANDGISVIDRNGIIINVNQRFCELHGFDRKTLVGTNFKLLESEDSTGDTASKSAELINGAAMVYDTEHFRKDGSRILLEVSSRAIDIGGELYIQSFHRDITEKKRLQEQLFQSQKMESIGALAGGIAHDFNNILTAILGHAELLSEHSNLDDKDKQRVTVIENSARKAGHMISKLLSFARKGAVEIVPLNLNDIIRDTAELLERMLTKKNVRLRIETSGDIPVINGNSTQIEQVIMNLVVNAIDAMPDGGAIEIRTLLSDLRQYPTLVHPLLSPGKYVVLTISDTGKGIPDDIKSKVFDPFFTTKGPGKGTGLGLSMVYGIVKEHKGVINLKSELNNGTTFEIYLPSSDKHVSKPARPDLQAIAGRETIFVIDDEKDILAFVREVLEAQKYKVIVSDNPVYAQEIFKNIANEIDLIITDIVMPLLNGRELIKYFKKIKPSIKVIAISGYDSNPSDDDDKYINSFLMKPFEGTFMLSAVRKALDSKNTDTRTFSEP